MPTLIFFGPPRDGSRDALLLDQPAAEVAAQLAQGGYQELRDVDGDPVYVNAGLVRWLRED